MLLLIYEGTQYQLTISTLPIARTCCLLLLAHLA